MKNIVMVMCVVAMVVPTLAIGIKTRVHSLSKVRMGLAAGITLRTRNKARMFVKFFNLNKMKLINIQYGKVFWNTTQMPDVKPHYPKLVKSLWKFSDRNCYSDEVYLERKKLGLDKDNKYDVDCLDKQTVRDLALSKAVEEELTPGGAIYYVNTMKIQQNDDVKNDIRRDFMNQFTFAILPADKEVADAGDFKPKLFTVIVPINPEVDCYVMHYCVFDYAKYKEMDLEDDKTKSCDYNIEPSKDYSLELQLTDLHAQYWANKALQESGDEDVPKSE